MSPKIKLAGIVLLGLFAVTSIAVHVLNSICWIRQKGILIMDNKRIADYVLCHLSDVAASTTDITEQIEEMLIHPHRNARNEPSLELWRTLAKENLAYISQGLIDLRVFEAAQNEG